VARQYNFSAGPSVLPEDVREEIRRAIHELPGAGAGVLECSHRWPAFEAVMWAARERVHRLLGLDDDQVVLFLHGGARTQFFTVPMNYLRGGTAQYLNTGIWSKQAIAEAERFGTVDVPFSSEASAWDAVPQAGTRFGGSGVAYVHYTSNNTVCGSEYHQIPDAGDTPLICDMSSDILSRKVDGSRFHLIYAGAQKNLGPSGATVVVVRKSWLDAADPDLPTMCRYRTHVDKDSLYNTPSTLAIYGLERMTAWIERQGLRNIEARNIARSQRVYGALHSGFWTLPVREGSRSRMNIRFSTGSAELDKAFVAASAEAGLLGLKGHSSIGGLRASLYNAQTDEAVDALVSFLQDFEQRKG